MSGGRVDLLKRLIELCTVAKRYNVKVILSSWYYLHTFWFTDNNLTAQLLGLPLEKRFMYFARGLDRILEALRERDLIDVIAFAEIFKKEVDGMEFRGGYEGDEPVKRVPERHPAPARRGAGVPPHTASGHSLRPGHHEG